MENVSSPSVFFDLTIPIRRGKQAFIFVSDTFFHDTTVRIGDDSNFQELNLTNHIFVDQINLSFQAFTPTTLEIWIIDDYDCPHYSLIIEQL
jgi:hypothetical protein